MDTPTLGGGARDPTNQSGRASEPRPFGVAGQEARSEPNRDRYVIHMEKLKRHHGDRMNRTTSPRRRSTPVDASPRCRSSEQGFSRRVLPTLKLGTYNGSTCLKTFLAKFENCSDYYDWNDSERLCHLRASLEGPAGQVLWDAGQQSSVDQVIQLLKNRFGSLNEEERYRTELKVRRRRRGESLQSVYQDIRRLMALAFPGQSGPLWEIMARDAFVESLGDPTLRLRVLERDPETLEQALKLASRLEALGYGEVEDNWNDVGRRKDRYVKTSTAEDTPELSTLLQELRSELKQSRKERERMRKTGDGCRGGPEFVAGKTDESVRPAQYFDHPAGAFCAGDWRTSPLTPPTQPQAPSIFGQSSTLLLTLCLRLNLLLPSD